MPVIGVISRNAVLSQHNMSDFASTGYKPTGSVLHWEGATRPELPEPQQQTNVRSGIGLCSGFPEIAVSEELTGYRTALSSATQYCNSVTSSSAEKSAEMPAESITLSSQPPDTTERARNKPSTAKISPTARTTTLARLDSPSSQL